LVFFFFQAEDGIRDDLVTGVQTCALPILAPVYLRTAFANEPFHRRLAVVMSVHNAGFQGHFPPETMGALGLPAELYNSDVFEWYGRMNALKGGMAHSNVVEIGRAHV